MMGTLSKNGILQSSKLEKKINIGTNNNEILSQSQNLSNSFDKISVNSSRDSANSIVPIGTIISYMGTKVPSGYMFCDGKTYNINDYKSLADQIKNNFGSYNYFGGDGEKTFAVPNLQGEFLRGYSTSSDASVTTGVSTENIGKHQDATLFPGFWSYNNGNDLQFYPDKANYTGYENTDYTISKILKCGGFFQINGNLYSFNTAVKAKHMSRPTNTSVLYCIKY